MLGNMPQCSNPIASGAQEILLCRVEADTSCAPVQLSSVELLALHSTSDNISNATNAMGSYCAVQIVVSLWSG